MDLLKRNSFQLLLNVMMVTLVTCDRSIVTGPDNTTISLGDSVTFFCTVSSDVDHDTIVAWKQNDRVITEDYNVGNQVDGARYSLTSGVVGQEYNLHITSVNTLDAGMYTCAIQSLLNPTETIESSATAWLSYKSAPSKDFPKCSPSEEMTFNVGEQVSFSCRSELAVPPVQLSWLSDGGEELGAVESTQGTLLVSEFTKILTKEDNGKTFECDLSHELLTNDRSCVVGQLNVQYPPTIITLSSNVEEESLEIGSTVTITCEADANPPSRISWTNSTDIPQSKIVNENFLIISDVTQSLNGKVIECSAKNDLGEATSSFTLNVNQPSTKAATPKPSSTTTDSTSRATTSTPSVSTKKILTTLKRTLGSFKPPALPGTKYTTQEPNLSLDNILGVERNFLIALLIGAFFVLLCFILLLVLVFGRKRAKTIVYVNSEDNLRKLSLSAASGNKILVHTPLMDRRNRTGSDNPSDDQSFDSAIHLLSPVTPGDQPDYRGHMINRSRSNISASSSQASGTGYMRVPSTELLINTQSQQRVQQPRYVVLDMVNQNGVPFPSADPGQVNYASATTDRPKERKVDRKGPGFETIPLRGVRRDQGQELYVLQGTQYIPVQKVMDEPSPSSNSNVKILIGGSDNSSEEELNIQEGRSLLNPGHRPV